MAHLSEDIAYYDEHRPELEADHFGAWVMIHDRKIEGFFSDFQRAAAEAVKRFGRGPYLIRQVGAPAVALPASVMFGSMRHAHSPVRV